MIDPPMDEFLNWRHFEDQYFDSRRRKEGETRSVGDEMLTSSSGRNIKGSSVEKQGPDNESGHSSWSEAPRSTE